MLHFFAKAQRPMRKGREKIRRIITVVNNYQLWMLVQEPDKVKPIHTFYIKA